MLFRPFKTSLTISCAYGCNVEVIRGKFMSIPVEWVTGTRINGSSCSFTLCGATITAYHCLL